MPQEVAIQQVSEWIQEDAVRHHEVVARLVGTASPDALTIAAIRDDPVRFRQVAITLAEQATPDVAFEMASKLPVPRQALQVKNMDPAHAFLELGFRKPEDLQSYAKKLQKNSKRAHYEGKELTFSAPQGRGSELRVFNETSRDLLPFLRLFALLKTGSEEEPVSYQELLQAAAGAALCVAHRSNDQIDRFFLASLEETTAVSLKDHEYGLLPRTPTFNREEFEDKARKAVHAQIQVNIAKAATNRPVPSRPRRNPQRNRRDTAQKSSNSRSATG